MNNEYQKLMKNLPLEKCPQGLTEQIMKQSGINQKRVPEKKPLNKTCLQLINYGCPLFAAGLLIAAILTVDPSTQFIQHQRMAANASSLSAQISFGFKTLLLKGDL